MIDPKYILKFEGGGSTDSDSTPSIDTEDKTTPGTLSKDQMKNLAWDVGTKVVNGAFDAASAATGFERDSVDTVADTAADVAAQFGPWGKVASMGIKAVNFLSKATGEKYEDQTLNTGSSGFADYSIEGKQFRGNPLNPLAAFTKSGASAAYEQQVKRQQEKFAMAKAVVDAQNTQNKARQQSLDNMNQNVNAQLRGGNDYSAVLAQNGTRLDFLQSYKDTHFGHVHYREYEPFGISFSPYVPETMVEQFQNGGSVIPSGELHKDRHDIVEAKPELEGQITPKGIPVVTMDENPKTHEVEVVQHAEIERGEVILELSITKQLEKLWKEGTDEAAIKAGKILAEELITNTEDNTGELLDENTNK